MIEEVANNFYRITLPMPFRLTHVHVYIIVSGDSITLFDTGINLGETFLMLCRSLRELGKSITNINHIFITHHHADHCGIAGCIKKVSGAVIHGSAIGEEIKWYEKDYDIFTSRLTNFYLQHGLGEDTITHLLDQLCYFREATAPYDIDQCVSTDKTYNLGDRSFVAIFTPGHAKDHICFYFRKEGILLAGDHVLSHITPNLSPDIFDSEYRPLKSYLDSLDLLKTLSVKYVWPAHEKSFVNLNERVERIKQHHEERKALIFDAVKKGSKNTYQISRDLFGENLNKFDQFLALNETYAHLVELQKEGLVKKNKRNKIFLYESA